MGQMRITWVAGDNVDRHGGLTDSFLAHGYHHLWTSPCPPPNQPAWEVRGPPRVGQGSGPLLELGRSLWSPERYYEVEELESGVPLPILFVLLTSSWAAPPLWPFFLPCPSYL